MTPSQPDFRALDAWIDAAASGSLTPEQHAQLERLLLADPLARQHYLKRVFLIGQLHWLNNSRLAEQGAAAVDAAEILSTAASTNPLTAAASQAPSPLRIFGAGGQWATTGKSLLFLMLGGPVRAADRWSTAATLLVSYIVFYGACFAILWSLRPQPDARAQQIAKLAAENAADGVATLVDAGECEWEGGQPPTTLGGRVTTAQSLRLRAGRIVLRFDDGAEVGIVGAAEARPISAGRIVLKQGRLAAHVPPRARGFAVETLAARFVDRGTDFSVEVSEPGETKMTVARGVVEFTALAQVDGQQKPADAPVQVTAGQSVTVSKLGGSLTVNRAAQTPEWVKQAKLSEDSPVAIIAYQTTNWAPGNYGENPGGLGLDFDVLRPIRVEALGVFDDLGNGIAPSTELTVQLWSRDDRGTPNNPADDRGGKILAEQRFDATSQGVLMAGHRFKSLATPVELAAGSYSIVAYGFSAKNRNINFKFAGAPPVKEVETWRGAIKHVGARWGGTALGQFPETINDKSYPYVTGSFKFRPLEPPSTSAAGGASTSVAP